MRSLKIYALILFVSFGSIFFTALEFKIPWFSEYIEYEVVAPINSIKEHKETGRFIVSTEDYSIRFRYQEVCKILKKYKSTEIEVDIFVYNMKYRIFGNLITCPSGRILEGDI